MDISPSAGRLRRVNVLWLTNSDDMDGSAVPDHLRSYRLVQRMVAAETGEPVEIIPKVIWPAEGLPDIIDGWVDRYAADVVFLRVNGYWYLYHSVPNRLRRKLGIVGSPVARLGEAAGRSPWLSKTAVFNAVRMGLLKTVGGDRFFEPAEVADVVEACVRRLVRREDLLVVLRAQIADWDDIEGEVELQARLRPICESLHIGFLAKDPRTPDPVDYFGEGDRLHTNEAGHLHFATLESAALVKAWRGGEGISDA